MGFARTEIMRRSSISSCIALGLLGLATIAGSPKAEAATFFFDHFLGVTRPDGVPPWLTVDVTDGTTAGVVEIKLTPNFVGAGGTPIYDDNVTQLAFKLFGTTANNSILPSTITNPPANNGQIGNTGILRYVLGNATDVINPGSCVVNQGAYDCEQTEMSSSEDFDFLTGEPSGLFDLAFDMPPPGDRASTGDIVTFIVKGPSGFSAASFGDANNLGYTACAKVQDVSTGSGSTVICSKPGGGEKVPAPLPLAGAALAFSYSRKIRSRINLTSALQR